MLITDEMRIALLTELVNGGYCSVCCACSLSAWYDHNDECAGLRVLQRMLQKLVRDNDEAKQP